MRVLSIDDIGVIIRNIKNEAFVLIDSCSASAYIDVVIIIDLSRRFFIIIIMVYFD